MIKTYKIGRLGIALESDTDFSDTEATRPFLCYEADGFTRFHFQEEDNISFGGEPVFKSSSVHMYRNNGILERVFILPVSDKAAAVTVKEKDGYFCRYDKKHAKYFSKAVNLFNTVGLERAAFDCGMFYLHCSFIALDGKAVLFSGSSGVGKSTRAEMFEKHAGANIINHDKALLYFENGKLTACGSPISGSSSIIKNESYPVSAIVFLKQSENNRTYRLKPADAVKSILKNAVINTWDKNFYQAAINFAFDCVSTVEIFESECDLSFQSVKQQRKELKV